jgi:putative endonuclease
MYFVYILQSLKDGSYYYGMTSNPENREQRHNNNHESYTRKKGPWRMIWCTPKPTRSEALLLEKKLKNMKSRRRIRQFIEMNRL